MQFTRKGVQYAEFKSPAFIQDRKIVSSSTCKHGWLQVKYRVTRWDTSLSSSVTLVQGFAGTCNKEPTTELSAFVGVELIHFSPDGGHKLKRASSILEAVIVSSGSKLFRLNSGCANAVTTWHIDGSQRIKLSSSSTLSGSEVRSVFSSEESMARKESRSSTARFRAALRRRSRLKSNTHSMSVVWQAWHGPGSPEHYLTHAMSDSGWQLW